MKTKLLDLKEEFNSKKEILESARLILKKEFIGIDKPIDTIIDSINSWFMLSTIQERPFIINLWGLTGVGKTSLINRLVELIDYKNYFYRFDLGHKKSKYSLTKSLNELCEHKIEKPVIIALDEFQHARTLEGFQKTEKEEDNRVIWDLIDSGKIQHQFYRYGVWSLKENYVLYKRLLKSGIKVEKGKIVKGWQKSKQEYSKVNDDKKFFISKYLYDDIIDLAGNELNIKLKSELEKILLSFNGEQSIQFLKRVINISSKPVERDFSKSLIFVMGNIDEAYTMSGNYSSDISADDFHKASLKITVSKIKIALQKRFRHEQISRLGNIHIIYPSLSTKAYKGIIKNELKNISAKIYDLTEVKIQFDPSIINLIYNEGVFPTQGVRPVLTTINHLIRNRITAFLSVILHKNLKTNKIDVYFIDKQFIESNYILENKAVYTERTDISSELRKININKKDDMQSITAVHESGHAVLSAVLLKTIPKYIYSNTTEDDVEGFVFSEFKWKYIAKKEIVLRVAMFLGGYAAEELVFGEENITSGSSSDIKKATKFVLKMLKKEGMGATKLSYEPRSIQTNLYINSTKKIEKEAQKIIDKAYKIARDTLAKEKKLLLELSIYLSDHSSIKEKEIEVFINKFCTQKIDFITQGDYLFYREHLMNLYKENCSTLHETSIAKICLNKMN